MNLRWKAFEKKLQARVRPCDARRRMRFWQKVGHYLNSSAWIPFWPLRGAASLGILLLLIRHDAFQSILSHRDLTMAWSGLWGLALAIFRTGFIWNTAQVDSKYSALWMLPVASGRIFHHLLRRLVGSSIWLFGEFLLVYCLVARDSPSPLACWTGAVVCALLAAAVSLALTMLLVALRINMEWIATPFFLVAGVLLIGCSRPQGEIVFAKALCLSNPLGWVNTVYLEGWVREQAWAWWWLLPVVAVAASLPFTMRFLQRLHFQGVFRSVPVRSRGPFVTMKELPAPQALTPAGQRQRILADPSLQPLPWERLGFVERLIARALNSRERVVAETLIPAKPLWTRRFVGAMVYFALFLAANTQIQYQSLDDLALSIALLGPKAPVIVVALLANLAFFVMFLTNCLFLVSCTGLPEAMLTSRANPPRYYRAFRLVPISYWDTAKVHAKVNTVICLLLLPLLIVFSLTPSWALVFSRVPHGFAILPKCLELCWGGLLFLFAWNLTPSLLYDGLKYWKFSLKTLLALAALVFLGAGLMASRTLAMDLLLGSLFLLGVLGWFMYSGLAYHKNDFCSSRS